MAPCHVLRFDYRRLQQRFEDDTLFGYLMMQKAAQGMRERLHDLWAQVEADMNS